MVPDADHKGETFTYGSLLNAFKLSSTESKDLVGLWRPHA
jgi:hypothetical protein